MFVYIWKHPNGTPFYVGMTKSAGRANPLNSGGRGWLCKQTLAEIGPKNVIVELHIAGTVEEAQALECEFITKYGRIQLATGPLTNLKTGGGGAFSMSEEGKERIRKRMKEHNPTFNPKVRAKIKARMDSPDIKNKFMGDNNPAKRPEVRAKLKAKWQEPEFREKQRQRKLNRSIHSENTKEKLRQKLLDPQNPMREQHKILNTDPLIKAKRVTALRTPEARAKISAGLKKAWVKKKNMSIIMSKV